MWSVIGALAEATSLPVTTGVTCPTVRIHPAVIAQAAATSGVLHEGRFNLGVGSGEALNEHILGDRWPEADVRLEMLEEAVEVIRTLWEGGQQSHHGRALHGRERARLRPARRSCRRSSSPASGRRRSSSPRGSATASATTSPDKDAIDLYRSEGGNGPGARRHEGLLRARRGGGAARPCTGCGPTRRCRASWRRSCRRPRTSSRRASSSRPSSISSPVGPDLDTHFEALKAYEDAGVDELFVQQIGPEQDLFFGEWAPEILKRFEHA